MAAAFMSGRKRARPSSPAAMVSPRQESGYHTTPSSQKSSGTPLGPRNTFSARDDNDEDFDFADSTFSPDPHAFLFSPAPLASSRYRLAPGHESPSSSQSFFPYDASSLMHSTSQSLSDVSFRRGRPYNEDGNGSFERDPAASSEALPSALARERNGRARAVSGAAYLAGSDIDNNGGVGAALYGAVSGVFGKVWDFWTTGSFRGFFAGGGTGYVLDVPGTTVQSQEGRRRTDNEGSWHEVDASVRNIRQTAQPRSRNVSGRHIPGGFPASSSPPRPATPLHGTMNGSWTATEDEADTRPGSSSKRASKRSRHSYADSSSNMFASPAASWVLVPDVSASSAGRSRKTQHQRGASPASAHRPTSRASLRGSQADPQAPPRLSLGTGSGAVEPRGHARRASAAGLRSPRASPAHSRQNSTVKETRVSLAPTSRQGESPIAVETARFVKDMKKAERREHREINRMNRTLQDMIREAKEALGTTVEVDMDEDEEMW